MKKKKVVKIIIVPLAVSMFWGCGQKTVDYGLDGDTEQFVAERDDVDVEQNLAETKVVEHWTDEWKFNSPVYADDRVTVDTMEIDADVVMLDIDRFPIIEAEKLEDDALFRKKFINTFFGGAEIREYELEKYTKDEIKEIIAELEEAAKSANQEALEEYEKFIRDYEELLETAPDEAVAAEDYMSSNTYSGELADDLACTVSFNEDEEGFWIYAGPNLSSDIFSPKSIREYDNREQIGIKENDEGMINECRYTMVEAKRMADAFLIQIGLCSQICIEVIEPVWCGKNLNEQGDVAEYETVPYGYQFIYSTGVDGVAMNRTTDISVEDDNPYDWQDTGDRTEIIVTDEGVIQVQIMSPIMVHQVSYAEELIPLEKIKEIMKKEALENTERYMFVDKDNFSTPRSDDMGLYYVKVNDAQQAGVFSFRPLWCLSYWCVDHPIFVDAVTGEVTYPLDETGQ